MTTGVMNVRVYAIYSVYLVFNKALFQLETQKRSCHNIGAINLPIFSLLKTPAQPIARLFHFIRYHVGHSATYFLFQKFPLSFICVRVGIIPLVT